MGYTLRIGQAYLDYDKKYASLRIDAEHVKLDNAPAYGDPTDFTNARWPSYTAWHDFAEFVGLQDLMFDKELETEKEERCLIYEHPGSTVLTAFHKAEIDKAYEAFYKRYPNAVPGYSPKPEEDGEDKDWPVENSYAVRLEWLKFWVDWALENCEIPIFYNS